MLTITPYLQFLLNSQIPMRRIYKLKLNSSIPKLSFQGL
jgi:hypothetical protein